MALIKCPECGKEISDKSKMCIGCGFPLEEYIHGSEENNKSTEKCEIHFPNGDYITLEKDIISLKFNDREFSDSINNFVLLHCIPDEVRKCCVFSFLNKKMTFYSGLNSTEIELDSVKEFKKFKHIMCNHKLFADRKYYEESDYPLDDVKEIEQEEKNMEEMGALYKRSPNYSEKISINLQKYIDDFDQNYLSLNEDEIVKKEKSIEAEKLEPKKEKEFHGIYRYIGKNKKEVYCPRCHSENCQYYTTERFVPGKTKTVYKANINPLKPFTLVNKKDKVITKDKTVTEKGIICNDCGYTFL